MSATPSLVAPVMAPGSDDSGAVEGPEQHGSETTQGDDDATGRSTTHGPIVQAPPQQPQPLSRSRSLSHSQSQSHERAHGQQEEQEHSSSANGDYQPKLPRNRIRHRVLRLFQFLSIIMSVSFLPHSYFSLFVGLPVDPLGWFVFVLVFLILPSALFGFLPLVFLHGFLSQALLPLFYIGGVVFTYPISIYAAIDARAKLDDPTWPANDTSPLQDILDSVFGKVGRNEARGGQEVRIGVSYFNIVIVTVCSILAAYFAINAWRLSALLSSWKKEDVRFWLETIGMKRYIANFERFSVGSEWFLSDNTLKLREIAITSLTDQEIIEQEVTRLRQTIDFKKRPYFVNIDLDEIDFRTMIAASRSHNAGTVDVERVKFHEKRERQRQLEEQRRKQYQYQPAQHGMSSAPSASQLDEIHKYSLKSKFSASVESLSKAREHQFEVAEELARQLPPDDAAFPTANAAMRHRNPEIRSAAALNAERIPSVALLLARVGMVLLLILLLPMYPFAYLSDPSAVVGTTRVLLVPTLIATAASGVTLWVMVLGESPYVWLSFQFCFVANILHTGVVILMLIKSNSFTEQHDYGSFVVATLTIPVLLATSFSLLVAVAYTLQLKDTVRHWPVECVALWAISHGIDHRPLLRNDVTGLVLMDTTASELIRAIHWDDEFDKRLFEQHLTLLKTGAESFAFALRALDSPASSPQAPAGETESAARAKPFAPAIQQHSLMYVTGSAEAADLLSGPPGQAQDTAAESARSCASVSVDVGVVVDGGGATIVI